MDFPRGSAKAQHHFSLNFATIKFHELNKFWEQYSQSTPFSQLKGLPLNQFRRSLSLATVKDLAPTGILLSNFFPQANIYATLSQLLITKRIHFVAQLPN